MAKASGSRKASKTNAAATTAAPATRAAANTQTPEQKASAKANSTAKGREKTTDNAKASVQTEFDKALDRGFFGEEVDKEPNTTHAFPKPGEAV
jgi:hypothetical protein